MGQYLRYEEDGAIGLLTLRREQRHNSLIPELLAEVLEALARASSQPELRALILQADGRSFSTGGDVQAFYDHRDDIAAYAAEIVGLLNQVILAMTALPVPIVAAVQGMVTGGSLGLVLASDVVLVAPESTFTPYYGVVGFSPDGGWSALLPQVIGPRRAAEALFTNRTITATEAVSWGLANRIVPASAIRAEARAAANVVARLKPGSAERSKRLLWGDGEVLAERLEAERRAFVEQATTEEARRGMEAFLRKR